MKTHKSPEIARLQLAAGAVGLTVATIGEAEVFVGHGVDDVFVAYPLWLSDDVGPAAARPGRPGRTSPSASTPSRGAGEPAALLGGTGVAVLVEVDSRPPPQRGRARRRGRGRRRGGGGRARGPRRLHLPRARLRPRR